MSVDLSALTAEDAEPLAPTVPELAPDIVTPDHKASKDKRASWGPFKSTDKDQPTTERQRRAPREKVIPKPRKGALVEPLSNMYGSIGLLLMPFDPNCASAVVANAQACAESLDQLAQTNPAARKVLIALTQTSSWGTVIAAHAPILLAIAMHHNSKARDMLDGLAAPLEPTESTKL